MADDGSGDWIEKADKGFKQKGSEGSFGRATQSKINAAKRKGGVFAKKAVFAQNMKGLAADRKRLRKRTPGKSAQI